MKKLIEGLRHFQGRVLWQWKELFKRSVQGQKPQALLITCSDSRVLPETLMQADPGDLFVSRNAGNIVLLHETPGGEAATVEHALATLGVTDLIGDASRPVAFPTDPGTPSAVQTAWSASGGVNSADCPAATLRSSRAFAHVGASPGWCSVA